MEWFRIVSSEGLNNIGDDGQLRLTCLKRSYFLELSSVLVVLWIEGEATLGMSLFVFAEDVLTPFLCKVLIVFL
jgi:hypothetical protein